MKPWLVAVTMCAGCAIATNPQCAEDDEETVDVDEDLGGYSIASMAKSRSGRAEMTEPSGAAMGLEIVTTPVGDALRQAWADCGGNIYATTAVRVSVRSDDHRIDVVLDGELSSELDGPPLLAIPDVTLAELEGIFAVTPPEIATAEVTGVRFDLVGIAGEGAISWTATGPAPLLTLADLTLPYAVSEDDFGP